MTLLQFLGLFKDLSAIVSLCILFIKPIRERVFETKKTREGQRCLLRADMLSIYYKNKDANKIRQYEKENFIYEYNAYKALGGNSFIDDVYNEVRRWEVVT